MKQEQIEQLLTKLTHIEQRLSKIENTTETELQKLQATLESLSADQQEDVVSALQRLDAKLSAIIEAQKLNFEIFKVFSGDSVQH
jgi:predicted  nucleic acid-binding Zn-ribbon protein